MSSCVPVVRVCVLGVGDHDEGGVELVQHEAAAQGQPGADRVQEAEQLLARHHLQYSFKRRFPKITQSFTITQKAPSRAFSWFKGPTSVFTFKTLC